MISMHVSSRRIVTLARPLCGLLLAAGLIGADSLNPADLLPAKLVPATTTSVSDGQGGTWNVDQSGALDGNMFNNLNALMFNQNWQFNCQTPPQQTPDGSELVLSGSVNFNGNSTLNVIRRIRGMSKLGVVRWIDIIINSSAAPVTVSVGTRTYFNFQLLATSDSGATVNGALSAKDSAVVIGAQPNRGNTNGREWVFGFGSARSKNKPGIMTMNNQFMPTWTLTIPAGQALALVHGMSERAQGTFAAKPDAVLRAWRQGAFLADVSPALRRILVNNSGGGLAGDDTATPVAIPAELLEARGDDADLLALGTGTRLRGEAASGNLTIQVAGQRCAIPWAEVLALAGGNAPRVFLRDGSACAGLDGTAACTFVLATGQTVKLDVAHIGWLLRRPSGGEGIPPGEVLVETSDQQRVVGRPGDSRLACSTVWGRLDLRLEDIASLVPAEGGGSLIALRDGSRFTAFCTTGSITIDSRLLGRRTIALGDISSLTGAKNTSSGDDDSDEPRGPWVRLVGDQKLAGTIDLPDLHLRLEGNRLPMPPVQIRALTNLMDEGSGWQPRQPRVRLELWTGDVAEGLIEETAIPLRTTGGRIAIPAADLLEAHVPTPVVAPATRARIAELVAQLGDRDWAKREAAVKALVRLGEVVRQDIDDARRIATDPEVTARLEQVARELK